MHHFNVSLYSGAGSITRFRKKEGNSGREEQRLRKKGMFTFYIMLNLLV